jgi:diguanylate cyclase (GGDEF)-like protein
MAKTREDNGREMTWGTPLPFGSRSETSPTDDIAAAEQRFHWLLALSSDPVLLHSGGKLVMANDAAANLFGATSAEHIIGLAAADLLPWQARLKAPQLLHRQARKPQFVERTLIRTDGAAIQAMVCEQVCSYRDDVAVQMLIRESHRISAQYTGGDMLTGLPDRLRFRERLKRSIANAIHHRQLTALVRLNINHFKSINASLGHQTGDQVLQTVAQRLIACLRDHDVAARLGGDEFGVILEGLHDPSAATVVVQRILAALAQPLSINERYMSITARIGIAFSPLDASDEDRLLTYAELAMEQARQTSPHSWQRYEQQMNPVSDIEQQALSEIERRYDRLTPREREVLNLLVAGKANKMVAYLLGTSSRTVENHRARIMDKMQAKSLAELVQMIMDLRHR